MAKAKSKTKKTNRAKRTKKVVQAVKVEKIEERSPEPAVISRPSSVLPKRAPVLAPYRMVLVVVVVLLLGLGGWLVFSKDEKPQPAQSNTSIGESSIQVKADVPDQQGQSPVATPPVNKSSAGQNSTQLQSIQPAGGSQQQSTAPQGYPTQTDVIMQRCGQHLDADEHAACLEQAGH